MPYPAARRSRRGRNVYGGGGTPSPVQRFFTRFIPAQSAYVEIPTVTAAGDFEVSIDFYYTVDQTSILAGHLDAGSNQIAVIAGRILRLRLLGVSYDSVLGSIPLSLFNTLDVERVSGTITATLNGTEVLSVVDNGKFMLSVLGGSGGGFYFDGYPANVNFKSGFTYSGGGNPLYP